MQNDTRQFRSNSVDSVIFIENPCRICYNNILVQGQEMCDECIKLCEDSTFRCGSRIIPCFYCGEFVAYEADKPYQDIACLKCIEKGKRDSCDILAQVEPCNYQTLLCNTCKENEEVDQDIEELLDEMIKEVHSNGFLPVQSNQCDTQEKDKLVFTSVTSEKNKSVYEPLFTINQVYSKEYGNIAGVEDGDEFLVVVYKKARHD